MLSIQSIQEDLMPPLGLPVSPVPSRVLTVVGAIARTVAPDGGQRTARRNAWRAMVVDRERAAGRREAALAYHVSRDTRAPIAR
jgi:hypothetical protein